MAHADNHRMEKLELSVNSALEILQDEELSLKKNRDIRRQKLREILYPQFNFQRMAIDTNRMGTKTPAATMNPE